jgi:serine/threonine protein kinase
MGQVFLGMSAGGRPIAVKVIRTELATDPEFRARFRREVAAAQKVSGLFTALVVDADLDSPTPWLATAYVAGPSLTEAVRDHGSLPVSTVLALAAGLAESLSAIHAAGVVHGDLKPSNVLLAEDGPRVIDFGISQAAEASAAAGTDLMIGSPGFMSPEQVLGSDISPASDIFSLGAVLTFAATGQGPFGSGSHAAVMSRLVNNPASLGKVPRELRRLIGSCLAKHPGDRPTAGELLTQVGAIQPAPGWLAESIISSFTKDRSAAAFSAGAGSLSLTGASAGQPPGGGGLPGRHRISRSLASACLSGALVAGSAVAVFALIGADRTPHAAGGVQPQAGAGSVATAPGSASNAPASARPSSSGAPRVSVAPNVYLTPSLSKFVSPSLAPTISTASAPSSTANPTKSSSPQPTKSSSSSASASASSSSSSPPASSPPASSPPASSPPASSPPASSPPASSPPASSPPASSPPASSPAASSPPASSSTSAGTTTT